MRILTAKYRGTCCDCGDALQVGDSIAHLGRGRARCMACHDPIPTALADTTPKPATAPGNAWGDALAWEPAPAPKTARNSCPMAPEPVTVSELPDGTLSAPAGTPDGAPVRDIVTQDMGASLDARDLGADDMQAEPEAVEMARDTLADLNDRILQRPTGAQRIETPERSPIAVRLVCSLLTAVIDAACSMGTIQRRELSAAMAGIGEMAGDADRADLWRGFSEALR